METSKTITIDTKDKIKKINKIGVVSQKKTDKGYLFQIDINKLTISNFLKYLSGLIKIEDIEIDNENIDNLIIKLYKEFEI